MNESELYLPVSRFFESYGYKVNAEVGPCDVTARKGKLLVVVELKRRISLKLVLQAVQRQEFADAVYVAVPVSGGKLSSERDIKRLFKRLELGLLLVRPDASGGIVDIAVHPRFYQRRRNRKSRATVLQEIARRPFEGNIGGSTGEGGRLTAYRMQALRVADLLAQLDESSVKDLRARGAHRAASILQRDYYGWFVRVRRGVYRLSDTGREALSVWAEAVERLRRLADTADRT